MGHAGAGWKVTFNLFAETAQGKMKQTVLQWQMFAVWIGGTLFLSVVGIYL